MGCGEAGDQVLGIVVCFSVFLCTCLSLPFLFYLGPGKWTKHEMLISSVLYNCFWVGGW